MTEYKDDKEKQAFYGSYRWKKLRKQVVERDNYECKECARQGRVFINHGGMNKSGTRKKITLVVHHILEREHRPDLQWDIDNLETLC